MTDAQPQVVERGGIRTERRKPVTDYPGTTPDVIDAHVTTSGAKITLTIDQAHELIDQLAIQLGRYDIPAIHKRQGQPPPRRT